MKILNTKRWLIQPKTGYSFRVEHRIFICHLKVWHYALVKEVSL